MPQPTTLMAATKVDSADNHANLKADQPVAK